MAKQWGDSGCREWAHHETASNPATPGQVDHNARRSGESRLIVHWNIYEHQSQVIIIFFIVCILTLFKKHIRPHSYLTCVYLNRHNCGRNASITKHFVCWMISIYYVTAICWRRRVNVSLAFNISDTEKKKKNERKKDNQEGYIGNQYSVQSLSQRGPIIL